MCLFFFFQAEDGIRDTSVTGVQTCALPIWFRHQVAVTLSEKIEKHDGRRHFIRQLLHPRCGGMQSQLESLEVEPFVARDHDLAVEHALLRQLGFQRLDELGEVTVEWPLVATLNEDFVAVAEHERAKAVPLRLEDPTLTWRQLADALREHRQDWRIDR